MFLFIVWKRQIEKKKSKFKFGNNELNKTENVN